MERISSKEKGDVWHDPVECHDRSLLRNAIASLTKNGGGGGGGGGSTETVTLSHMDIDYRQLKSLPQTIKELKINDCDVLGGRPIEELQAQPMTFTSLRVLEFVWTRNLHVVDVKAWVANRPSISTLRLHFCRDLDINALIRERDVFNNVKCLSIKSYDSDRVESLKAIRDAFPGLEEVHLGGVTFCDESDAASADRVRAQGIKLFMED